MNLNNLMTLSLFLLLSFVYLAKATTPATKASPTLKLSINVQKDNKPYPLDQGKVFIFRDGDQTTITCNLKCNGSECYEGHKYSLHLYLHKNEDTYNKTVNFTANTTASVSRAFTLHENDTEVVCEAKYPGLQRAPPSLYSNPKNVHLPTPAIVRLQYTHAAPGGKGGVMNSSAPQISPGYFKDSGNTFALFTCTAQKERLALLSWLQMKGSDRILLKTVLPSNLTEDTLNKTLTESDRDTKLFCAARYFLHGHCLSNITESKMIALSFNRTIESVPQETRELSFAEWMSIIGAIIVAALIVVTILIAMILKYKRKVKEYARDEEIRNRPAVMPPRENVYELKKYERGEDIRNQPAETPQTENVYDQVYGHGAGLKRPRVRPADKQH